MEKTVFGIIGLGDRGCDILDTLSQMKDVEIRAICDFHEDRLARANSMLQKETGKKAQEVRDADELFAMDAIEAVIIATSWDSHIPLALKAMRQGKYAAIEVGPAHNLDECWQLVRTSEETGVPCMMLENCCYGDKELAVLQMIRRGLFGEVTHVRGGYHHDMRWCTTHLYDNSGERAYENLHRNGDLYLTHELGPIMNYLGLNRGNRMVTLCSMASKARGMTEYYMNSDVGRAHPQNFAMGDVITTMIKCASGETILLTHDTCLDRTYSRGGHVQGTKGIWNEEMNAIHIDGRSEKEKWEPFEPYLAEFRHPLWRDKEKYTHWHHGGMDFLMLRALVHSVKEKTPPPIDVYDAATMMAISVLTEQSIAMGSQPVQIPDFTGGRWLRARNEKPSRFALDAFYPELFDGQWEL